MENPETTVTPDFNLASFFDFSGASFHPNVIWAVEGTLWFEAGADPMVDIPFLIKLKAVESVPFWIITREQIDLVIADGVVTVSELLTYDPLIGHATAFTEVLRPWGPEGLVAPVAGIQTSASGKLTDGRKFNFKYHTKGTDPTQPLDICEVKFNIVDK